MKTTRKRKVAYYFDDGATKYNYGTGHPMKPQRVELTHDLLDSLGVLKHVTKYRPLGLSEENLQLFHTADYVKFLRQVNTENIRQELANNTHNLSDGGDCPVFNGIYQFNQRAAGASVGAAYRLNQGDMEICVNWGGGFHHAKRNEASGFCYVNDIVLSILELCRRHERVLYVDIDIHHGDGVEEAFYCTDRVCTVSFHKYGENFFPKSGAKDDIGVGAGKGYSLNVPLKDGMDDQTYVTLYDTIMTKVMEWYRPTAVVMCCGADSLAGDRLGTFNMSEKGHSHCIEFFKKYNIPILLTGGGGYTVKNVACCWSYETALCVEKHQTLKEIPMSHYWDYYAPDFDIRIPISNTRENQNDSEYLNDIVVSLMESMRNLPHAPSAPISAAAETLANPMEQGAMDEDTPTNLIETAINPLEFYDGPQQQDPTPPLAMDVLQPSNEQLAETASPKQNAMPNETPSTTTTTLVDHTQTLNEPSSTPSEATNTAEDRMDIES